MPLIRSGSRAAVSQNIREMQAAGHPHDQAIAAALRTARQYGGEHMAGGGFTAPMGERMAARQVTHEGFLHSSVPGRTDKLPISVAGGAYVLPADHVAALGQGNSNAGAAIVNKMFHSGPYGSAMGGMKSPGARPPRLKMKADGGEAEGAGKPVPIIAAGGEIVLSPQQIIKRFGSLEDGHKALDRWVLQTRKKHIKTLRSLKPPKKD